jgi:hypothetical protein
VLLQVPYSLSALYLASAVLLDSGLTPVEAHRVAQDGLQVALVPQVPPIPLVAQVPPVAAP